MEPVETWLLAQGQSTVTPITLPTIRISGTAWMDGDRLWYPRGVSYLSALRSNRTAKDWVAYCQWAVRTKFNGLRTFGGFRVDQMPAEALAKLPAYLDVAAEHGLAVEFTALTGTADMDYNPQEYIHQSAEIIRPFRDHVILELANEYTHPSQDLNRDELEEWGREYCDGLLWAIGAPDVDEPTPDGYYPGAGGRYCTAHLDRGRDFWNQCRRVREIYAVSDTQSVPCLDNEPLGADEKDGSETGKQRSNDPAFFATLGALDRAFPGVGGVHHNQAGLDAVLPGPVQQQCADAYVGAHFAVDGVLGQNVPFYKNTGHFDSPVLSYTDATRCYSFTVGNRAVTVGIGLGADPGIVWGNGWQPSQERFAVQARDSRWLRVWEVRR